VQLARNRRADAARGASNQDDLVGQWLLHNASL
jgi:hypothetical protein